MRKPWLIVAPLLAVLGQPSAHGDTLRDSRQVDIAPVIEGQAPNPHGIQLRPVVPKGTGNGDSGRLSALEPPAPQPADTPNAGLGVTVRGEDAASPLLSRNDEPSIAGLIRYRQPLP